MVEKPFHLKRGFDILKIKLGQRPSIKDVERMQAIREAVGDDITLQLMPIRDGDYLDARKALQAMDGLNIEHCEEPIHADNLPDQVRLNAESPVPIMADESVF